MTWRFPVLAALALSSAGIAQMAPRSVQLKADDGLPLTATFYPAVHPRATILLFHQAGSSRGEYATIAPRLARMGYDALAIDQRVGGRLFGRNPTAERVSGKPSYAAAQHDLEGALAWGSGRGRRVILWGSSYSAALVFRVAAAHPDRVAAVLAFSPGEYLDGSPSVATSAARVRAPVFVTSASDPEEIASARRIIAAVRSSYKTQYIAPAGIHGASTLNPARNPRGAAANWNAVQTFLARAAP